MQPPPGRCSGPARYFSACGWYPGSLLLGLVLSCLAAAPEPGVDTLQLLPGPDPYGLQLLFGTTSEPPVSLQTNMQVSTLPSPPLHEIFQGFSANHAVLITPQGLVYIEVPVFADAATYRRLVGLQADPPPGGGIMRLWQPLPLLPHVQFLEIHCSAAQVPCVLDFRPMGWRIMTVCVDPPVSACSAVQAAVTSGVDIPGEWIEDCHASRLGVLHKERAVRPSAPLLGGPPFVLLFFPHIFGVDDSSSDGNVGGGANLNPDHTVLPPLGEESGGRTPPLASQVVTASSHSVPTSAIAAGVQYGAILDTEVEPDHGPDNSANRPCAPGWWLRPILFLAYGAFVPSTSIGFGFRFLAIVDAVQIHSAPASPRDVVLAPDAAVDAARLATPAAHRRLQSVWYHFGDFGYGTLWPVPGSTAHDLRFSLKVWHPEQSHTVELLGATDAATAAAEVRTLAGRTGRTQVYAAAGGLPAGQVHLVAAPRDRSHVAVFFEAGVEVWCVDVPRHTNSEYLLSVACSLASTDALQISSSVSTPLRNGDVLGVRLETDHVEVDLSEHLVAQPDTSASVWLDPVRRFTLLTAASGATTYQIARSAEVDVRLLRGLVRHIEGPGGTFLELPVGAFLRRPVWLHCALDFDHVVFRVTEAWDPNDVGLFFVFRGTFPSYADFNAICDNIPRPVRTGCEPFGPMASRFLAGSTLNSIGLGVPHFGMSIAALTLRVRSFTMSVMSAANPQLSASVPLLSGRGLSVAGTEERRLMQRKNISYKVRPYGSLYLGRLHVSWAGTRKSRQLLITCGALPGKSVALFPASPATFSGPSGMATGSLACARRRSPGILLLPPCVYPCGSSRRLSCMGMAPCGLTPRT